MFATLPTREWGCARRYNPTPLSSAHSVLIQEPRDSLSQVLNLSNHHVPVNFPHAVVSLSNDSEEVSKIVTVNLNRTILEILSQRDPRSPHDESVLSQMHYTSPLPHTFAAVRRTLSAFSRVLYGRYTPMFT